MVFSAAVTYSEDRGAYALPDVRDVAWYRKSRMPLMADGVLPFLHYVIRQKGKVELGSFSCAMCHTRVMPGGALLKGAQGNFPFNQAIVSSPKPHIPADLLFLVNRQLYAMPWLDPDPINRQRTMSPEQVDAMYEAIPPGVVPRHRSSPFSPVQVPDLIGVQDRHYLDHTGLLRHYSVVDLMRYSALNQGADSLASYDGFIPADLPKFKTLPDPDAAGGRYSDDQLYALALYIYSLKPPENPNRFDSAAVRGQRVFENEGCAGCHTPPLYTNNKLTPADGFRVPADHVTKYDILAVRVGTDADLALKTRRGTGYYKVPSLKGVWYRSMFGHSGWCATLEDWFDPKRLRDDYVPTGFRPYGTRTFAVKGHAFGLALSDAQIRDLIAFLKTL
jgi:mono/diheme cytochrome c family protein